MLRPFCLFVALFFLLLMAHPAPAQSTDFVAVLSGGKHPLTLKLKDLDSSWRRFTLSASSDATSQMQAYFSMMTGGALNTYYTQGETETVGGETYLISYHQPIVIDSAALMHGGSEPPPIPRPTSETVLSLSLLNLRLLGSLNDIQSFSLDNALKPAAALEADLNQASVSNLKQIGLALLQYTQDYDETLPRMHTVAEADDAVFPYLKARTPFEQPATHELYQVNTSLSHRRLGSVEFPAEMVVYYEASPDADGLRAVLFLDGHVKRVSDAEWQQLKTASHVPNPQPAAPVPKGGGG